jgi:hypothetical protein
MKWEYKVVEIKGAGKFGGGYKPDVIADAINVEGNAGWEMVEVFSDIRMGNATQVLIFFKRQKA